MDKYEHKMSYLTYMQMGSFRFPLGMGLWSQEVPSQHTKSAILFYNNNLLMDCTQGPIAKAREQWALRT